MKGEEKVLLDTNMLLSVYELRIDIQEEIEGKLGKSDIRVLEGTIKEIQELRKQGKRKEKAANIALEYIKKRGFKKEKDTGKVDETLEKKAVQGYWIATNDKALRGKIKEKGGKTLYLRSGKYLE